MIDIHTHILPGLDDGARSLDEAVAMLRMAKEAGTTDIVASPHANQQFAFHPESVERAIARLRAAAGDIPRIHYGCEMHLTPENMQDALRAPARYSIAHAGYLLVELSDSLIPRNAGDIFMRMLDAGMRPILAHPERNPILQARLHELEEWVASGCLTQITAQSLSGGFGRPAKAAAQELLQRGMAHFIASDAHDPKHRPPLLAEARETVEAAFGPETAARLFSENPRCCLQGMPVCASAPRRKRFRLW